ncbi:MAG: GumC family protein [Phycisphaerales bacterium]
MNTHRDSNTDAWMEPEGAHGSGHAHTPNPIMLVHRALRGRYLLAIAIGMVLAIPGALVGYKLMPPVYTSEGRITIDPTRPVVLYENEINDAITGFESFVRSQSNTLRSPRVLQDAANRLVDDGHLPPNPANWVRLQSATQVAVGRGSRDMRVLVTMRDPRLAERTAAMILASYIEIAEQEAEGVWTNQINAVREILDTARLDRESALAEARRIAEEKGTIDLERRRLFVQEQLELLEREIQDLEIDRPPVPEFEGTSDSEQSRRELTDDELAEIDPDLGSLHAQRRAIEQRMTALLARVTERHPDYLAAVDERESVQVLIAQRTAELRELDLAFVSAGGFGGQRLQALKAIKEERITESRELAKAARDIEAFREEARLAQERIDLATRRAESLRTEQQAAREGRIRISQQAEVPFGPSEDRRKPLAAMGAAGGFGFSLFAFTAYGFLRPRYRYVADLEDEPASPPVLGLVPQVADGKIEGDDAAQAGVHQIRSLLESMSQPGHGRVIVITSATAAEGKSTLAAALAASMAHAGRRTLLVDGDLVGRGVSSRLAARELLGLSDFVARGGEGASECIHEVEGRKNLELMPAGIAEGFEAEQLSSQAVEDMVQGIRQKYDAVVIDTGPILGSLEANAAVAQADQVVLVVSRGQNARLVKLAIERLHRFSAAGIGLVFNRAMRADIERSTSAASVSVRSRAASRQASEQAAMSASA